MRIFAVSSSDVPPQPSVSAAVEASGDVSACGRETAPESGRSCASLSSERPGRRSCPGRLGPARAPDLPLRAGLDRCRRAPRARTDIVGVDASTGGGLPGPRPVPRPWVGRACRGRNQGSL